MKRTKSWLLSGALCLSAYVLLVLWLFLPNNQGSMAWRIENWWESGGFFSLISVSAGYLLLQIALRGSMTPGHLGRGGFFVALIPFLFLGNCAGEAYQAIRALDTERSVETVEKYVSPVDSNDVRLVVQDSEMEIAELELRDGRTVRGFEVPISREFYDQHRVGDRISVVELPGEPYPFHCLTESAKDQVRGALVSAAFWAFAAAWGLLVAQREFLKSEAAERMRFSR